MPSKSEAYIHVKARLWNSTLVNDYPRVDLVKIVSSAHISIPEIYNIKQKKKDDKALVYEIITIIIYFIAPIKFSPILNMQHFLRFAGIHLCIS